VNCQFTKNTKNVNTWNRKYVVEGKLRSACDRL